MIQRRPYGKPVDVWSTGILLHILLSGTMPFLGTKDRYISKGILGKGPQMGMKDPRKNTYRVTHLVDENLTLT